MKKVLQVPQFREVELRFGHVLLTEKRKVFPVQKLTVFLVCCNYRAQFGLAVKYTLF